jgi:hypothetical protein
MRLLLKNEADCLIRQHKPRDRPLPDLQRRAAAPYRASGFVHRPETVTHQYPFPDAQAADSPLRAAIRF